MAISVQILKTNGLIGTYQQSTTSLANEVVKKLVPRELFTRGQMVFGTGNPYTLLNPRQVSCIIVESKLPLQSQLPPGVDTATEVTDRDAFLKVLDQRWSTWRKLHKGGVGSPYEALVQLELVGGWEFHTHAIGTFPDRKAEGKTIVTLLDMPVLCIKRPGKGMIYINPENVNRARIYHSNSDPFMPQRLFPLDTEEI